MLSRIFKTFSQQCFKINLLIFLLFFVIANRGWVKVSESELAKQIYTLFKNPRQARVFMNKSVEFETTLETSALTEGVNDLTVC